MQDSNLPLNHLRCLAMTHGSHGVTIQPCILQQRGSTQHGAGLYSVISFREIPLLADPPDNIENGVRR